VVSWLIRRQRTEDRFRANLFCGSLPAGELLGVADRDIFAYGQNLAFGTEVLSLFRVFSCAFVAKKQFQQWSLLLASIIFIICALIAYAGPLDAAALCQSPDRFIERGAYLVARPSGEITGFHQDILLTPASIWKIGTAAAALHILGADFRFVSEFYQDKNGALYIKGLGDPSLTSEEVEYICHELKSRMPREVEEIFIDQDAFQAESPRPAWQGTSANPYDAANYATVVNFNTVNLRVTDNGRILSGEPQTPLLPIMARLGKGRAPGLERINISQKRNEVNRYTAELFRACLEGQRGRIRLAPNPEASIPPGAQLVYRHHSRKKLKEIIKEMLKYSNNFTANQIFLSLGIRDYAPPAAWEKSQRVVRDFFLDEVGLNEKEFRLLEGSGLARGNRVSAKAMYKILRYFAPYHDLLPQKKGAWIKSGTMTGVYSYAGYLPASMGRLAPFVIILNQETNSRDQILAILRKSIQNQ